jgi:putative oligomerization/nucleic acid binding protein
MPLIRAMARTAVVAGTATAVSNRVSRRQANRWAAEDQDQSAYQQAPPPAAAPAAAEDDTLEQLKKLGELRDAGVLTEAEFQVQKERLLAG